MKVISEIKLSKKVVFLVDTTHFGTFGLMLFKNEKDKDIKEHKKNRLWNK